MDSQQEISFEDAIARLEEIVRQLDEGTLALNESLVLFEEGVNLARQCSKQLTEAQGRLEILTKSQDGTLETESCEV